VTDPPGCGSSLFTRPRRNPCQARRQDHEDSAGRSNLPHSPVWIVQICCGHRLSRSIRLSRGWHAENSKSCSPRRHRGIVLLVAPVVASSSANTPPSRCWRSLRLLLIGTSRVAKVGDSISDGLYLCACFSVCVESLNLRMRGNSNHPSSCAIRNAYLRTNPGPASRPFSRNNHEIEFAADGSPTDFQCLARVFSPSRVPHRKRRTPLPLSSPGSHAGPRSALHSTARTHRQ